MTDAKIKELEGQLLALREALKPYAELEEIEGEGANVATKALTDTAQAGREAEARVLERWANGQMAGLPPEEDRTDLGEHNALILRCCLEDANRLRNGGLDDDE